jgi:hypothetical protein
MSNTTLPQGAQGAVNAATSGSAHVVRSWLFAVMSTLDSLEDRIVDRIGFRIPALVVLAWFAGLATVAFVFHEPWRDETQSWLMARDMTVVQLFRNAAHDGHPIGWHLLIKPLTLLELPFLSLRLLNMLLVLGAAALVIWKSPFRLWQAFFLVSSPPFVFCAVYARCYSLILVAVMLQACLHPLRMIRPYRYAVVLGLLANTMSMSLIYAALMGAWWLWEALRTRQSRHVFAALTVLALLGVLAAVQIIPPPDKTAILFESRMHGAVKDFLTLSGAEIWSFVVVPFFFFVPLTFFLTRCALAPILILLSSILFALGIHVCIYPLFHRHYFTLFAMLLAVVWVATRTSSTSAAACRLAMATCIALFIAICPESYYILRREVRGLSSNVGYALPYVQEHLRDKPVAAHFMSRICPLLAYMPGVRFWNPASGEWGSYVVFDSSWYSRGEMPIVQAVDIIFQDCPVRRPVMIFSGFWKEPEKYDYVLVFVSDYRSQYAENVFIYVPKELMTPDMVELPVDFSRSKRRNGL